MNKMTAEELKSALNHFNGTKRHHGGCIMSRKHVLTDGVKFLCDNASCYWLADLITSYHSQAMRDEMLRDMQFWTLKVNLSTHTAVAICERDTGNIAFQQTIEYTDFPLEEVKIWVAPAGEGKWVLMLNSEY